MVEDKKISEIPEQVKAFDTFLSTKAEAISRQSMAAIRVNFDGTTERGSASHNVDIVKSRVAACREAYENVGIVGNAVDLMVDFALEGFVISHPNPAIEQFYKNWAKSVKLNSVAEGSLKGIYRDGNTPIYTFRSQLTDEQIKGFKRTIAKYDEEEGEDSNDSINIEEYQKAEAQNKSNPIIPSRYSILDLLKIQPIGNELLQTVRFDYFIGTEDLKILMHPKTESEKAAVIRVKKELNIQSIEELQTGQITLESERFSMLFYKKDDYKRWATPMLWRIIDDVKFKKLLRDMDISVAESVQNALTIIKLGSAEKGLSPTPDKYTKLATMLKNPSKSKIILWDDLIDITSEYPPVEKILGKEKYEQVDGDIRSGLGIAEVLLNGEGGNYSNSFLSVKTLLERLETGRRHVLEWIREQIDIVAKSMHFRKPAFIKLTHMSLRDEEVVKKFILELVDRNMLSYKSTMEYFGENFDVELQRMRSEDKIRKQIQDETPYALLKTSKYGPQHQKGAITIGNPAPSDAPEDNAGGQGGEGDNGGRPSGDKKKQSKKRDTKPKGQQASIILDPEIVKEGVRKFNDIYATLAEQINIDHELNEDPDTLYGIFIRIMSHCDDPSTLSFDDMQDISVIEEDLAIAPAKLERCVKEVTKQKVDKFKKSKKRKPNKKEMKDIVSSAWGICRSSLKI